MQHIKVACSHRRKQCRALDQLISGHWIDAAFGCPANLVICSTNALQERGNRPRRAELTHKVNRPNVNTKFE
jgi:hypothetical protein